MENNDDLNIKKIKNACEKYLNWIEDNPQLWRLEIDSFINHSKIRAFHMFFNSLDEALCGTLQPMGLDEKDLNTMYPYLFDIIKQLPASSYMCIFACNNVIPLANGSHDAMIAYYVISYDI